MAEAARHDAWRRYDEQRYERNDERHDGKIIHNTGDVTRGRFYFWPLLGMLWVLNASAVQSQENAGFLLSAAAQDTHQINMGDKKDGNDFQHVHALAIDASGKAMFLVLTSVCSGAMVTVTPGKGLRSQPSNPTST